MPFTLFQADATLRTVNMDGGLSAAALTLPTGVTLATNKQPRFARFNRYAIVVNTPSRPLAVGPDGTVYPLTPTPPGTAVALSAGAAGTLTGNYRALQTFKIRDSLGNIISESDYGPAMVSAVSISAKKLHADFAISTDSSVNDIQLYRTTTNGSVYLPWAETFNNTTTSIENDIADAALGLIAGPELGTAPDLVLVAEYGGRVWGVSRTEIDFLRYTTAGTMYGWNALNTVRIPHVGDDDAGITTLLSRRAALGVSRRSTFSQITGSQRANITPTIVNGGEGVGSVSQEAAKVYNDIGYFLAHDGVYKWDSNGITCVTDGAVRTWFTTDTYFNRSMFWRATAEIDPFAKKYYLFLASRGSDVLDRWVEMDLLTGAWYGPHTTNAFTPSCTLLVPGRNQKLYYMVGSREGYISQPQEARNDWGLVPIDFHVAMRGEEMEEPEQEKYFGELSVHVEPQASGTLTITPALGDVDETTPTDPMTADLTQARTRVGRVGSGNSMVMDFTNNEVDVDVALYGYEIDPVNAIGRR